MSGMTDHLPITHALITVGGSHVHCHPHIVMSACVSACVCLCVSVCHAFLRLCLQFKSEAGHLIDRECDIVYISFSAHVDYIQNRDFIQCLDPTHIVRFLHH